MPRVAVAPHQVPRAHKARKHRHGHGANDELPARRSPSGGAVKRKTVKPLRMMVLMDSALVPPDEVGELSPGEIAPYKTELDVYKSLRRLGHDVRKLGVRDD